MRMRVDYLNLNGQTDKYSFSLPIINQVWPSLAKAKYFASLDLLMRFHQVMVNKPDCFKTAFLTHRIMYVYNVMRFGLCNAPATFERLIKMVLKQFLRFGMLINLEDVAVCRRSRKTYRTFTQSIKLLIAVWLKCKAKKCYLFAENIYFLGHVVSCYIFKHKIVKFTKLGSDRFKRKELDWPAV